MEESDYITLTRFILGQQVSASGFGLVSPVGKSEREDVDSVVLFFDSKFIQKQPEISRSCCRRYSWHAKSSPRRSGKLESLECTGWTEP